MLSAYFSKKLTPAEKNYCVTRKKKLLAIVYITEFFFPYLYVSRFTICTDHAVLKWLKPKKNPEDQHDR